MQSRIDPCNFIRKLSGEETIMSGFNKIQFFINAYKDGQRMLMAPYQDENIA